MTASTKEKRLDTIEVRLTPRDWAIRLAQEMRSQPSEEDFVRVVADKSYRAWPWVKPFFKLRDQAEARYPDNRQESIHARNQSAQRLRTEFHALKKLICKANEIIRSKAETMRLKTALKLSTLHTLILQDVIARTAKTAEWAKHYKIADAEADEDRQRILEQLCRTVPSLIEDWVDEMTMLLMDVFAHKAAVREIQKKYFDGHPILFCDAEAKLVEAIKSTEDTASTFNEYLTIRRAIFESDPENRADAAGSAILGEREGHLVIDIEAIRRRAEDFLVDHIADEWVNEAREHAKSDILQETGEHGEHIWQTFRERVR